MTQKGVWRLGGVAAAIALLAAAPSFAQTTGRLTGILTDQSAGALPGASVTITSPSLQGSQTTTSDSNGEFRFLSVPPGTYTVKVSLAGFKSVEQVGVSVGLDRTVHLPIKLEVATVTETVTVTGEAPVIDTSSTSTGVNVTAELFQRIPLQRDIYDVARVATGAQTDTFGAAFYGSTSAENQYIIEGVNVTGIETGVEAKTLNFDFIEEIEVKTGGLPAEYGRLTGGALNVLTKSGGNTFKGSVFGFFEGGGLQSDDVTADLRPETTTNVVDVSHKYDFGFELGGFLVKDKVWFFGAYNRVEEERETEVIRLINSPGTPAPGSVIPRTDKANLFAGKLTWKLSPDHTLTASAFGDPTNREGAVFPISGPPSTWQGTRDFGSTDYSTRYDGVFGNSFLVRALYGRHNEKDEFGGAGRDVAQILNQRVSPTALSGGFGFFQDQKFSRDIFKMDLTKFLGSHEFKLGGDFENVKSSSSNFQGGAGQRIYMLRTSAGSQYIRHRFYVDDLAPDFDRADPTTWHILAPQISEPNSHNLSAYIQDSWKVGKGFTLNAGLRWEQQDVRDRFGETAFKIDDNWSPRVGFIWDVKNNGKSKLYANYGRFYESVPQDINIRAFGGEVVCFCNNFSLNPGDTLPDPAAPVRSSLLGGEEPVDPSLKGQFIDEYIAGFEYEVAPNFVLGVKGTHRNLGRVIEDFLVISEGTYFIANPGEGTFGTEMTFYDYSTVAAPKAERKQWAFELSARKRFSNGWQFMASYLWNSLEGNYDGLFQNSTGQLDPNINSAFDYADFLVNAQGKLSAERKHQIKFDGSYQVTSGALEGLNAGLSTWYYSGLPLNAYGYSFLYSNWEYYLVPRGSLGRGPSDWEANLHLSYPIKLSNKTRLNLVLDVFNVFNRQEAIQLDDRYNITPDGTCAGIPEAACNGDNGLLHQPNSIQPVAQLQNPLATATNPDFLIKGSACNTTVNPGCGFTGTRSIRLGARFTF